LYLAIQGKLWEEKYKPDDYSLAWSTMSGIATYVIYRIKPGVELQKTGITSASKSKIAMVKRRLIFERDY